jgi:hypothetical protein
LIQGRIFLNKSFEQSIFFGLKKEKSEDLLKKKVNQSITLAKDVINRSHKATGEIVKDVQVNLDN